MYRTLRVNVRYIAFSFENKPHAHAWESEVRPVFRNKNPH